MDELKWKLLYFIFSKELKSHTLKITWEDELSFKKIAEYEDNGNYNPRRTLSDDEYLKYITYRKGRKPSGKLVFHGGCLGCDSQEVYGINRCDDCLYFRFNQRKEDLSVTATEARVELQAFISVSVYKW
jgi:hypothetical protein